MYTAEQIKPKKYSDEKPSESGFDVQYRVLLDDGRQALFDWNPVTPSETMRTWDRYVEWFIDIPNPPDELKFLAYPQNKPEQDGLFIAHEKPHNEWDVIRWSNNCDWDSDVIDWFISYRLDKENEPEKPYSLRDIWKKYFPNHSLEDFLHNQLNISLEDIERKLEEYRCESELLPCANPECGNKNCSIYMDAYGYRVDCLDCGYNGPVGDSRKEAVRLHNLIRKSGITQHEYDLKRGNPYDLNDVAKLTRKEE